MGRCAIQGPPRERGRGRPGGRRRRGTARRGPMSSASRRSRTAECWKTSARARFPPSRYRYAAIAPAEGGPFSVCAAVSPAHTRLRAATAPRPPPGRAGRRRPRAGPRRRRQAPGGTRLPLEVQVGRRRGNRGGRREEAALVRSRVAARMAADPAVDLVVCGDFNESPDEYLRVNRRYETALMPIEEARAARRAGGSPSRRGGARPGPPSRGRGRPLQSLGKDGRLQLFVPRQARASRRLPLEPGALGRVGAFVLELRSGLRRFPLRREGSAPRLVGVGSRRIFGPPADSPQARVGYLIPKNPRGKPLASPGIHGVVPPRPTLVAKRLDSIHASHYRIRII